MSDPNKCAHDYVGADNVCKECGTVFVYCHACSLASGADKGVYHTPPTCSDRNLDKDDYNKVFDV